MRKRADKPDRELTGVDDVRFVREKIAALYGGDIEAHVRDSNRIAARLIKKYKLRKVASTASGRLRQKVKKSA